MKYTLYYLMVFSICSNVLFAQKSLIRYSEKPTFIKNSVTDTKVFFSSFFAMKKNPQRGEFETIDEYKKRMSKQVDTSKEILLCVSEPPTNQTKNYKYDIDNNILMIFGGKLLSSQVTNTIPIVIQTTITDEYIINFTNLDFLPDSLFDTETNTFRFSIFRLPKEAEILSKSLTIVVGVKPISYRRSNYEHKMGADRYSIDARLIHLSLYNQATKKFILDYFVKEDSSIILQRKDRIGQKDKVDVIQNDDNIALTEKEPSVLKSVEPEYPDLAKRAGLEGNVFVKVLVDEEGKVRKVVVLKCDAEIFVQAAEEAAKQWIFQPAIHLNKPTSAWVLIPFRFRLPKDK